MWFEVFFTIGILGALYNIYFLAKREGFLEEKVADLLVLSSASFLFAGKVFFILLNPRIYGYYNLSSILNSGYDLFFGIAAAFATSYIYIRVINKWSLNKVADILAKGISFLAGSFFIGSFFEDGNSSFLFLGGLWFLVFFLFNFLERVHYVGASPKNFSVKRVTGWAVRSLHMRVFLMATASIFFLYNAFSRPPLWKIKSVLYGVLFLSTIVSMTKDLKEENLTSRVKETLLFERKKVEKEEKELTKNDPYFVKGRDVENAEGGDEVMDDLGHREVDMQKNLYAKLKIRIDKTLALINLGRYGKCEKCGGGIEVARLKANPYAITCVSCSLKGK